VFISYKEHNKTDELFKHSKKGVQKFMDDIIKIISIILGSSFLASLITALISKRNNDKNNTLKYVTDERQKWRILIKERVVELVTTSEDEIKQKIIAELQLNLNPNDKEDIKIITAIKKIVSEPNDSEKNKAEVLNLVAKLLKHDWERAKVEASNSFWSHKVIVATSITWFVVRIVFYDSTIVYYIRNQNYFKGMFSKLCFIIIIICTLHIILKNIDKYFSKKVKYRNIIFKFLGIPVREIS